MSDTFDFDAAYAQMRKELAPPDSPASEPATVKAEPAPKPASPMTRAARPKVAEAPTPSKPAHDPVAQRALALLGDGEDMAIAGAPGGYNPADVYDASMRAFNEATRPKAEQVAERASGALRRAGGAVGSFAEQEADRWAEANARNAANLRATAERADELNRGPDVVSPFDRAVPAAPIPTRTAPPVTTPSSPGSTPTQTFGVGEKAPPTPAQAARRALVGAGLTVDEVLHMKDAEALALAKDL